MLSNEVIGLLSFAATVACYAVNKRLYGRHPHVLLMPIIATPVVLVFSERQVDVLSAWEGEADCTVITRLSVLPKLRNRQQLTALIRSGDLEVQGDLQVVQNMVSLCDLAEFDPAELLAPYTGDIVAEGVGKVLRGGAQFLLKGAERQQRYVAEAITEEWRLAPGPLELAWFAEETTAIERALAALEKRLETLEGK